MANEKDRPVRCDANFGNLCTAVKCLQLLPPILSQEGSAEKILNCSKTIFF